MEILNFIGGEYVPSTDASKIPFYNPATGLLLGHAPNSDAQTVNHAVASAQKAFPDWSGTSIEKRSLMLEKISKLILERADQLAKAESINQGKPLWLTKKVDIPRAAENFSFFASALKLWEQRCSQSDPSTFNITLKQPLGVCALIAPWNLPLYLLTWKIAPALAAGNTAVCKPSELTPVTAHILTDIFLEAGLPLGVCNIVYGLGNKTGEALIQHPDVKGISFTGGTKTGKRIAEIAAPQLKKVSLELGGKNPNIIFADCDLDACLDMTIKSSFLNQGQICLCGSNIFVEESIYETFLSRFVEKASKLIVGDPQKEDTFMGPLVSAQHLEKVQSYVDIALKSAGRIFFGGQRPILDHQFRNGFFLSPTILSDVPLDCPVMKEEIFGPVVTVSSFKNLSELKPILGQNTYGLSASIWTSNLHKAYDLASFLSVGQIWVNTWMKRDLRVPFGGMKDSGLGREGGFYALDFYSESKNLCVQI